MALFLRQALGQAQQRDGVGVAAHLAAPVLPDQGEDALLVGNRLIGRSLLGHVLQFAADVGGRDLPHTEVPEPGDGQFHLVAVAPAGAVLDARLFVAPKVLRHGAEGFALFFDRGGLCDGRVDLGLHFPRGAAVEVPLFAVDGPAALDQAVGAPLDVCHTKTSVAKCPEVVYNICGTCPPRTHPLYVPRRSQHPAGIFYFVMLITTE